MLFYYISKVNCTAKLEILKNRFNEIKIYKKGILLKEL
jgi:hypothetical protein